jgi:hypothetical protein
MEQWMCLPTCRGLMYHFASGFGRSGFRHRQHLHIKDLTRKARVSYESWYNKKYQQRDEYSENTLEC